MSELLKLRVEGSREAVKAFHEFMKNHTSVSTLHTRPLRGDTTAIFGDFSIELPQDPAPAATPDTVITVQAHVVRDEPRGLPAPRRLIGP